MIDNTVTKDAVIAEIKRLAGELGRAPGVEAFSRQSGIAIHHWLGVYWSKWSDALAAAGLAANQLNSRLDSSVVLERLAEVTLNSGRIPPKAELKMIRRSDPTFPHDETFRKHFGGKEGIAVALRNLAATDLRYSELADLLPELEKKSNQSVSTKLDGWVYLLKSSAHFKIGRSDTVERRIKEISIALPESVSLIHAIQTDDPVGIEAYWHRRFADRRANGEWFKLEPEDLRAFKRRKFQ